MGGSRYNLLLAIHRCELLNKTQYAGSLTLNDKAHKVTDKKDDYADKVDRLVDNMGMRKYKWDEQFYNEIVKDSKFSFGKFNDPDYPIHLSQS